MKGLTFELSGKTGFFKKPDVNSYAYFTYNNIHKIALLGILGAIVGLRGYNQREPIGTEKSPTYPEFYEKLKNLKISIVPKANRGYFQKKIQVFNNSVGYASKESGGNLIVREQWLENPKWDIFIMDDSSIEKAIYNRIEKNILESKCEFIPYLGKNDHMANIRDAKLIQLEEVEEPNFINSLFPVNKVRLDDQLTFDEGNPYIFKETLPIRLNREHNFYEYIELGFTNLEIEELYELDNVYRYNDRILSFI